jgi:hypothetical protein
MADAPVRHGDKGCLFRGSHVTVLVALSRDVTIRMDGVWRTVFGQGPFFHGHGYGLCAGRILSDIGCGDAALFCANSCTLRF